MNDLNLFLNAEGLKTFQSGHPWVMAAALKKEARLPKVACLYPLGSCWYAFSPQSQIRFRRWNLNFDDAIDSQPYTSCDSFRSAFAPQIEQQFVDLYAAKRERVDDEGIFRWIFSDNDGWGGLIVDVFESTIVCQILGQVVEVFWPVFKDSLGAAFEKCTGSVPSLILERRDHAMRLKEGLEVVDSKVPIETRTVSWNGLRWALSPGGSQKTGSYLDQRTNHRRVLEWAQRLRVEHAYDICCFEGGFGLHLLSAGIQVTAVDSSQSALDRYQMNAQLNELNSSRLHLFRADAFEFLKERQKSVQPVDLIVLDPPPFAKNKHHEESALRGFFDLNLRAVLNLRPSGLLVTCSCSHRLGLTEIKRTLRKVERQTGRRVQILEVGGAAPDHAPSVSFPEGEYLTAVYAQVF